MQTDIADVIAIEIKKEIADRYFGFRKLIEEDKLTLSEQIRQHTFILEKRISFDLIRIYILLKDDQIIQRFMDLVGLEDRLFYDPYLTESKTIRHRVFQGLHLRGLTKKGCFSNAIIDCYERLGEHVSLYREKFEELVADQEMISEEINIFYKKNDLGSILGFLQSLGDPGVSSGMQGGMEHNLAQNLEEKLHIPPPSPVEQFLPILPPFPQLKSIGKQLNGIISQAFTIQKHDIHSYLSRKESMFRMS